MNVKAAITAPAIVNLIGVNPPAVADPIIKMSTVLKTAPIKETTIK